MSAEERRYVNTEKEAKEVNRKVKNDKNGKPYKGI